MQTNTKTSVLPLSAVAGALGIDLTKFNTRKGGELCGGVRSKSKNNTTSFSDEANGRLNCFRLSRQSSGAIYIVKAVQNVGFQAAVEFLMPLASVGGQKQRLATEQI
jgi:hypothetical protein